MDRGNLPAVRELRLTRAQLSRMRDHLQACLPLEGCGLLAGLDTTVHEVIPITNVAGSPVRFRMDGAEQVDAFNRIEEQRLELVAIFHSHPAGPEAPSPTDIEEAAYEVVQIIWSHARGTWHANGYWIGHDGISEVKLNTADVEPGSTNPA